jgi:hypothetical protein
MDTRLNSTVTVLRIAIGLMATLAGLDPRARSWPWSPDSDGVTLTASSGL